MDSVLLVVVVVVVAGLVIVYVRGRGRGLVAKHGMSIGGDMAMMADRPRARVAMVAPEGSGRVRLVLSFESLDGPAFAPEADREYVASLEQDSFGFGLLRQWQQGDHALAVAVPPGGRLLRLRSTEDLQHLTLRLVEWG